MTPVYSIESFPIAMQRQIVSLVARLSIKTSLLDKDDLMTLTGRSKSFVEEMIQDPLFPAPYRLKKNGQKQWRNAEVMAFINSKREAW